MKFNNIITKKYDDNEQDTTFTEKIENDQVQIDCDSLRLDFEVEQAGTTELYWVHIPMTQGNRKVLKKVLSMTGNTVKKETDSKGRFNLGTEHANEEKEVIILE